MWLSVNAYDLVTRARIVETELLELYLTLRSLVLDNFLGRKLSNRQNQGRLRILR